MTTLANKNICHVITRLIIGGAQENTLLTCRGLVDRGHRVTLVTGQETGPEGSLLTPEWQRGIDIITCYALRREVEPLSDLKALRQLTSLFNEQRPDVVHTHSSKAGIIARLAAARAAVPIIVHTIHGMSFNRTQPRHRRALFTRVERYAAKKTHKIIAVADAMITQSVAAKIAPREKFVVIRSGMEIERFTPDPQARAAMRKQWGAKESDVVVGTVARMFDNKGYEDILAALPAAIAANDQLRFVWVGDGTRRAEFERKLEALNLRDRVHLTGLIPPDQVPTHVQGFDIILHASRWEGLPRALVQGLLTGVPAISYDNDGAPEIVIPGETGVLVPLGDVEGLSAAVAMLAEDADERRRMGAEGRRRCLAEFDWRVMVDRIEDVYKACAR